MTGMVPGDIMKKSMRRAFLHRTASMKFVMVIFFLQSASAQILPGISLFPDSTLVRPFSADAHAHRMDVEDIALSRNIRASMGAVIPFFGIDVRSIHAQASLGASIHSEIHPLGQAHVVSNDYYIDYLILDVALEQDHYVRFVTGHTSHHLSDNWYERLKLTTALRYSRDYLKLFYIYGNREGSMFYAGADYAYIFTIGQRISRPWTFQAGGELDGGNIYGPVNLFGAVDVKFRQEVGFAATMTYQIGATMPMRRSHNVRIAYQFRHGIDERGQFYSQHRTLSTIGIYFDL